MSRRMCEEAPSSNNPWIITIAGASFSKLGAFLPFPCGCALAPDIISLLVETWPVHIFTCTPSTFSMSSFASLVHSTLRAGERDAARLSAFGDADASLFSLFELEGDVAALLGSTAIFSAIFDDFRLLFLRPPLLILYS